jgi:hypothetical protein
MYDNTPHDGTRGGPGRRRRRRPVGSPIGDGVSLAARLLFAATVLVGWPGDAHAKKDEVLAARIECVKACLVEEGVCQAGCCGRIFCRKSCLGACFTNEGVCETDCDVRLGGDPDGAFFDTAASLRGGRVLRLSGPLQCPAGATVDLSVTVTQHAGPIARGHISRVCPVDEGSFTARAVAIGSSKFQPLSAATACAVARIHTGSQGVNSIQWCRDVTILPPGVELED